MLTKPTAIFSFIFISTNLLYHFTIMIVLLKNPNLFTTIPDKKLLTKINIGNALTLFRMSALPNILALIIIQEERSSNRFILPLLIIGLSGVFITDFLDGYLSRKRNECTELGSILDSSSDYLVLFVITVAFFGREIIGPIIFTIIVIRGLTVMITGILFWRLSKKKEVESTYIGKVSIFAIMTLYALELLENLSFPMLETQINEALTTSISAALIPLEWIVCTIVVISIADKVIFYSKKIIKS